MHVVILVSSTGFFFCMQAQMYTHIKNTRSREPLTEALQEQQVANFWCGSATRNGKLFQDAWALHKERQQGLEGLMMRVPRISEIIDFSVEFHLFQASSHVLANEQSARVRLLHGEEHRRTS
jgi:hypothetical protein